MTLIRRVNDWLVRYPLTFAVIVIAIAALALASVALIQSSRIDDNSVRLDDVENQQCLDARYKFAQTEYIDALTSRDQARITTALNDFHDRSIDLVLNAGGHPVKCVIDLSTIPSPGG